MRVLYFDGKRISFHTDFEKPIDSESIVRVNLAGICGTDLEILNGYMSYEGILGHEFVGTVVKSKNKDLIGKKVVGEINVGCQKCDECKKGMERHCPNRTVLGILNRNGSFSEYLRLPERNLHVVPGAVTEKQAVFVEPLAAAFEILEQVKIERDWMIAIVGDGRLAQLIARVLKLSCKNMICFGKHEKKLERLKKIGINTKIGIATEDEKKFDVVVEVTGKESGFSDSLQLVKPRGMVILKSTIASKNKIDLSPAVVNEVTFVGSRCGVFRPAIDALASGIVKVDDLVDSVYSLEDYQIAFERAKHPESLKVLLKP